MSKIKSTWKPYTFKNLIRFLIIIVRIVQVQGERPFSKVKWKVKKIAFPLKDERWGRGSLQSAYNPIEQATQCRKPSRHILAHDVTNDFSSHAGQASTNAKNERS